MSTILPISIPPKRLQSDISSIATSFTLNNIKEWDGTDLVAGRFGTRAFACFQNLTRTQIELIEFDPSTIASATITIIARGLDYNGDDVALGGTAYPWTANDTFVELGTDLPQLYKQGFVNKTTTQTITGKHTFPNDDVSNAGIASDTDTAVATAFVTLGQLSRTASSGASNASTTVKGIVELATQAEGDARTTTGGTGAKLALTPDINRTVLAHDGLSSTGSANAYVLTVVPAETAYVQNQVYNFKANFANTGSATLNVSGLGAKTLKTPGGFTLVTGDILSGQIVECYYNGTDMIVTSVLGQTKISQDNREIYAATSSGNDTYAITAVPAPAAYVNGMEFEVKLDVANTGAATLNVNSLGAIALVRGISTALQTGDLLANQIIKVRYNSTGTVFQIVDPPAGLVTGNTTDASNWHYHNITQDDHNQRSIFVGNKNDGFTTDGTGTETITRNYAASKLITNTSSGDNAVLAGEVTESGSPGVIGGSWGKATEIQCTAKFSGTSTITGLILRVEGLATTSTPATQIVLQHYGFQMVNGVLYASCGDGSAGNRVDVSSGITLTNFNVYRAVHTPGVDVKFYINGTLVQTTSTNLPTTQSGSSIQLFMGVGTTTTALRSMTLYNNYIHAQAN